MKRIISMCLILSILIVSFPISICANANSINVKVQTVSLGYGHSAAIKEDSSLWLWGYNQNGQLGDGSIENRTTPIKIMENVASVSLGYAHSAAIKKDGSLYLWGNNLFGQLGDGTNDDKNVPIKIMDNVVSVSLGGLHSAAIKEDGSLWMWGENYNGELGDGTYTGKNTPIKVMDNVKSVSCGDICSAAIKEDGSLYVWGSSSYGQLGDGTRNDKKNVPNKIMDNIAFVNMGSVGSGHSAAIKEDGSLYVWGSNFSGELGDGTYTDKNTPIKVMDNVISVGISSGYTVALKKDGSIWTFGRDHGINYFNDDTYTPIKRWGNIISVYSGSNYCSMIKEDGSLWMWGENYYGEIGDGTKNDRIEPVKVMEDVMLPSNIFTEQQSPVAQKEEAFYFDESDAYLNIGDTLTLTGYFDNLSDMNNMYERISVVSSDENIVKITNQYGYSHLDTLALEIGISGVGEGNANVSVYFDGNKLSQIDVTVEAIIADVITEEKIIRAKMLEFNKQYRYYRLVFKSPAQMLDREFGSNLTERSAKVYLRTNEVLSGLALKLPDFDNVNGVKYYESLLTDILETNNNNVWDSSYEYWKKVYDSSTYGIVKKLGDNASELDEIKTSDFFKKHTDKKIIDTVLDFSDWKGKDIKIEADVFDKISLSADLVNDFFETTNEVLAYSQVQSEKISALKYIFENTKNEQLKAACANVIKNLKFAHKNAVLYYAENFSKESIKDLLEYGHSLVVGVVLNYISIDDAGVTPYVPGVSEAIKIVESGQFISDNLINAENISKDVLTIIKYAELEDELKNFINKAESELNKNKDAVSAENCIALAEFYKSMLMQSCDIYSSCVKNVKKGDTFITVIKNILKRDAIEFIKNIKGNDDYDELILQANNIKESIKNTDFYANSLGIDIAQIISEIITTEPSEWSREYVNKAITYGIIPKYLQGNYQNNITRAEFCTLLTKMIEKFTNKEIIELMDEAPYNPKIFEDSYYEYVYYMSYLGIVNGVSETEFNPLGEITREEAATMLMRTAKYLGIDTSATAYYYEDVSSWAQEGVNFVTYTNIMNGTDKGFEPKGTYTKEQAITTFVRFYENLK